MSKQVPWNKIILEEFIRIGGLTKECQKYSPILPPRKSSVEETYMDEN